MGSQNFCNGGTRILRNDLKNWPGSGGDLLLEGEKALLGWEVLCCFQPTSGQSHTPLLLGAHQPLAVQYQERQPSHSPPPLPSLHLPGQDLKQVFHSRLFAIYPAYQAASPWRPSGPDDSFPGPASAVLANESSWHRRQLTGHDSHGYTAYLAT